MIPAHLTVHIPDTARRPDLSFFCAGKAAPGGSKRGFGFVHKHGPRAGGIGVRMVDDGKNNKQWRAVVSIEARVAVERAGLEPFTGPVVAHVVFVVARPKAHLNSKGQVKANAPKVPTTKPDSTKLWRAVEDALTGIVWIDDAQVVQQRVSKVYGPTPGVWLSFWSDDAAPRHRQQPSAS